MDRWLISYDMYINKVWRRTEHIIEAKSAGKAWNIFIFRNSYKNNLYDILLKKKEIIHLIAESLGHNLRYISIKDSKKFKDIIEINDVDILDIMDRCNCELDSYNAYYAMTESEYTRIHNRKRISKLSIQPIS